MKDPQANACALRKVGTYLRDSVYSQILWAIDALGVREEFKATVSPMEIIYKKTGQKIIFRGADNPSKIKSTKFQAGYCKFIWFEECDQFSGMEEVRNINQSLMRGGDRFNVFYSYNPPKSVHSWINSEILMKRKDRMILHTNYRDMPKEWLGKQFILEARHLKRTNLKKYENEYLGLVTGTGGEVFSNVTLRKITDAEIESFEYIKRGLDFGYATDPLHYTVLAYDRKRRKIYIFYEIHERGLKLISLADGIKAENINNDPVCADSSEPRSISELFEMGVLARGAKKGPDSVYYGMKFLQDLDEVIIDPEKCPNTAREFRTYEYEKGKDGKFRASFSDRNNHSIDAVRYALEDSMRVNMGKVLCIRKYGIY